MTHSALAIDIATTEPKTRAITQANTQIHPKKATAQADIWGKVEIVCELTETADEYFKRTTSGSLDTDYYIRKGRQERSEALGNIWHWLKRRFNQSKVMPGKKKLGLK